MSVGKISPTLEAKKCGVLCQAIVTDKSLSLTEVGLEALLFVCPYIRSESGPAAPLLLKTPFLCSDPLGLPGHCKDQLLPRLGSPRGLCQCFCTTPPVLPLFQPNGLLPP